MEIGNDNKKPWHVWVPGVLSLHQVTALIDEGYISFDKTVPIKKDHSSIDLTLSDECWELTSGSVKPSGDRYLPLVKQMDLVSPKSKDQDGSFHLQNKKTYLLKINENIAPLKNSSIYGQATAKSSIGRMDVLARLIVDGMSTYEEFYPELIGNGSMFLEITPMTFNVKVQPGKSLSQLRLFKGRPEDCEIKSKELYRTVVTNVKSTDGSLSLTTQTIEIDGKKVSAFGSKVPTDTIAEYIQLWGEENNDPKNFWDLISPDSKGRMQIALSRFFIMRSYEKIAVPKGIAVYCRAIDETIGEMRIHYAGFAHPFFGYTQETPDSDPVPSGTPLVFEVRGHDVNVSLAHGEKMAKLIFYRMSEDANIKDNPIKKDDKYQKQDLQLSKFFKDWQP